MTQTGMKQGHGEHSRSAREARARARAHAQARRKRMLTAVIGGIVCVGLILGGVLVVVQQRSRATSQDIGIAVADEGRTHVAEGSPLTFKHYPPSSGAHYPTPAQAGFFSTPIAEGNFVHSLEHGYIVILYKSTADTATMQQLRDLMTAFPKTKYGTVKLVITPYDHMNAPITALAWQRELPLASVDRDPLLRFYQAYVNHGPEDVP